MYDEHLKRWEETLKNFSFEPQQVAELIDKKELTVFEQIRLLRKLFGLSLVQAKEALIMSETGLTLEQHQEKVILPALKKILTVPRTKDLGVEHFIIEEKPHQKPYRMDNCKRFQVPYIIKGHCPSCGEDYEEDLSEGGVIEYPVINEVSKRIAYGYCDCGEEWEIPLIINVSVSFVKE
jgi:hypothetical protein